MVHLSRKIMLDVKQTFTLASSYLILILSKLYEIKASDGPLLKYKIVKINHPCFTQNIDRAFFSLFVFLFSFCIIRLYLIPWAYWRSVACCEYKYLRKMEDEHFANRFYYPTCLYSFENCYCSYSPRSRLLHIITIHSIWAFNFQKFVIKK